MLESLLLPRRARSRAGLPLSILLHGGVIALALLASRRVKPGLDYGPEVRFYGPFRAQTARRAAPAALRPRPALQRRRAVVQPMAMPEPLREPPPEIEPEPEREPDVAPAGLADESGIVTDRDGESVPSAVADGSGQDGSARPGGNGVPDGKGDRSLRPFDDSLTPPRRLSGPDPEYTLQALEHEVEGTMLVRCVLTVEGTVHDCSVLRSLPFMDRAVIEALERRRYSPALENGKPVEVSYVFTVKLRL
jgi:periplasmic protein TonB